jgi:hypothetical protein
MSAAVSTLVLGCQRDVSEIDGAFYDGDGRLVHCGLDLDTVSNISLASIDSGLDRARDRGEVVELYAHHPGVSVPVGKIAYVLAGATARGLEFVTYADFARGSFARGSNAAAGLALSFDDTFVDAWVGLRPLFAQYHARVTFFVSRYKYLYDGQRDELVFAAGHPGYSQRMATMEEISDAVSAAVTGGASGIALLKCNSGYPAPPEEMNLRTIPHLAQMFGVPFVRALSTAWFEKS